MKGNSWSGEIEDITKSGRRITVLLRADAIKDDQGKGKITLEYRSEADLERIKALLLRG